MTSNNTKLLIIFSILIILAGFSILWLGTGQSGNKLVLTSSSSPNKLDSVATSSGLASNSATLGIEGQSAFVERVVDGDTIDVLLNGQKFPVRLVGVDTPETVDPRRPVGCFGKEASNETKSLLTDKTVVLQKDVSDTDKYHRLLRFVFLPQNDGNFLFVDDYLIREGFGKVLTIPPDVKYADQFLQAQQEARENKRGLWGKC